MQDFEESWVTQITTSEAIHEGVDKLQRIFGIAVAVDSAERILDRTGTNAEHFQDNLPPVEAAAEGEFLVESTDNKGIVMRRKQMATVCGCYSIDPFVRTPEDVLDALFRENKFHEVLPKRPRPKQARYQVIVL